MLSIADSVPLTVTIFAMGMVLAALYDLVARYEQLPAGPPKI